MSTTTTGTTAPPAQQNGAVRSRFIHPKIQDNPKGWGPVGIPNQFQNLPFQHFSKGDKIGKVADWTGQLYSGRGPFGLGSRYAQQQYSTTTGGGQAGTQYAYYHDEEDATFQLVDTSRPQKTIMQKANKMRQLQYQRKLLQKEKERRIQAGYYTPSGKGSKTMNKEHQRQYKQWKSRGGFRGGMRGGRFGDRGQNVKSRQPSVQIRPDWEVLEEMDFPRLQKLNLPGVEDGRDIAKERYGTMEYYDKSYDRVGTRSERPLQRISRNYYTVTTTEDPVIQRLAKQGIGQVYATDIIMATLMCATRSIYSWDVLAIRIGDKLFLDKRDRSDIDYLTVSETATEPPQDEGNSLNSPRNLALEATFINRNFSQQVLKRGEEFHFENPIIPFLEDGQNPKEVCSVGYRYRQWKIGERDGKPLVLVARTEHDGVSVSSSGKTEFLTIKAFNEWDSRFCGGEDWRSKLEQQRGALLATEMKNNAFKLAKWTCQSLLASSDQLKFGYVSRLHNRDSSKHVILGTQQFFPNDFATSISLKMESCWGILRVIVDKCLDQPPGKYLFMKDPNKAVVRMYRLPPGTFDTDEEEGDEDEEDEDAEEIEEQDGDDDDKQADGQA